MVYAICFLLMGAVFFEELRAGQAVTLSMLQLMQRCHAKPGPLWIACLRFNIGVLIIRIGLWGPLYYDYNKEPAKQYW